MLIFLSILTTYFKSALVIFIYREIINISLYEVYSSPYKLDFMCHTNHNVGKDTYPTISKQDAKGNYERRFLELDVQK